MKYYKLNDLCTDVIDCSHSTPEWKSDGIRIVRNFNLKNGNLDFSDGYFVDEATYLDRIRRAVPKEGDIIISREAPMGIVAIVPKGLKCCLGQRLVLLKVDKQNVNPIYLLFMLMSDFVQTQFRRADATGSIVSNLCIPDLKDIIIPVIEDGQKNVAELLNNINEKILLNQRINDNLEQQLLLIFDYWFNQFNFPGKNSNSYCISGGEMNWNDTLKRHIPFGWQVKSLGELCTFRNGINYDKAILGNKYYRIINVRDITSSSLFLNENKLDEICLPQAQGDKYCATEHDIIIARSGTPGSTRLIHNPNNNTIFCGFIICCTPINDLTKLYLTFYLKQLEGTSATKTGGSILQNVSQETLKDLKVCLPPEDVLKSFNTISNAMLHSIYGIQKENSEIEALRNWLLPMLMNGQATIED